MPRPLLSLIVSAIGFALIYLAWPMSRVPHLNAMGSIASSGNGNYDLPADLEARVLSQFDRLVDAGVVSYQPSEVELYERNGFQWEFRQIPNLKQKPILEPTAPGRKEAGGPFVNPTPDVVVAQLGQRHRLLINKYCIYRPMLLLTTATFEPQTDDLNADDIAATLAVLRAFSTPQIMIYNCGVNAGSSQGHKHVQIFPQPESGDSRLWPSKAISAETIAHNIPHVPFRHFVLRLPTDANASDVYDQYLRLLRETRKVLDHFDAGADNNVIMTLDWIALVPRRTAVWGGPLGANAAGMIGLVSIPDQEQRDIWAQLGYEEYLTRLGAPFDD